MSALEHLTILAIAIGFTFFWKWLWENHIQTDKEE